MTDDPRPSNKPPPYASASQRLAQLLEVASKDGRDVLQLRSRLHTLLSYLSPSEGRSRKSSTVQDLLEDVRSSFNATILARQFGVAEEEWNTFKEFEEEVKEGLVIDCEDTPEASRKMHSPVVRVAGTLAMGVGAVVIAPVAIVAGVAGAGVGAAGLIVTSVGDAFLNVFKQGLKASEKMGAKASEFATGRPSTSGRTSAGPGPGGAGAGASGVHVD